MEEVRGFFKDLQGAEHPDEPFVPSDIGRVLYQFDKLNKALKV